MKVVMALLVATIVGFGVTTTDAAAHSAAGTLTLDVTTEEQRTLRVRAALSYADDGHAASSATVTASASLDDGTTVGPVTLEAIGLGGYEATLAVPATGVWTVRAEAEEPTAAAETTVDVRAAPAATEPEPDPDGTARDADADVSTAADEGSGDGGGSDSTLLLVGAAVVVVTIGLWLWFRLRHRH